MSMRRSLYSAAIYGLLPLLFGRLLWKSRGNPAYRRRWPERLGFLGQRQHDVSTHNNVNPPVICLHAVSVGEVMAARPLVEQLLITWPQHRVLLTSTTPTGSATVKRLFAERVQHCYLPYDTPGAVKRFLRRTRPEIMLVMETELWPNLFAVCAQNSIPVLLINARLSERSVRRYLKISGLVSETLADTTAIMARSQQDAEHFQFLGAGQQVQIAGNIKFDVQRDQQTTARAAELRRSWGARPVWCAGSTHRGEDKLLLEAHDALRVEFPDLLLIVVPRHPERFDEVAALCAEQGFTVNRRSQGNTVSPKTAILLGDSMGELLLWYAASDIAFIGGSLVPVGGHNPLEALNFGVPVLTGSHTHNFADVYPALIAAACVRVVASQADLQDHLRHWLSHAHHRQQAGLAGQRWLDNNRGVTARLLDVITMNIKSIENEA